MIVTTSLKYHSSVRNPTRKLPVPLRQVSHMDTTYACAQVAYDAAR
jgi:hypothetical protein